MITCKPLCLRQTMQVLGFRNPQDREVTCDQRIKKSVTEGGGICDESQNIVRVLGGNQVDGISF